MRSEKAIEGRTSRLQATPGSRLGDNRIPLARRASAGTFGGMARRRRLQVSATEAHDGKGRMAKNGWQKMKTPFHIFRPPFFAPIQYGDVMRSPNQPAPGNAGWASRLAVEHDWPGVPEPER
jgi:hypothetical protein